MPAPKPYTSQPLPLAGVRNTRDLGGFPFVDEQGERHHRARGLLRSGSLTALTLRDRDELEAYGLVRWSMCEATLSCAFCPTPYARRPHPGVSYAHIPLMDQLNSNGFAGLLPESCSQAIATSSTATPQTWAASWRSTCRRAACSFIAAWARIVPA